MTDQQPREVLLELHELESSTETQPREYDPKYAEELGELITAGVKMPPIVVFYDGARYRVADGWHRRGGAEWAGKKSIACLIYEGDRDAANDYANGSRCNIDHGKRLTNSDKRARAEYWLRRHPKWSNGALADVSGLHRQYIATVRPQLSESDTSDTMSLSEQLQKRLGRDGKEYPAKQPARATASVDDDDFDEDLDEEDLSDDADDLLEEYRRPFGQWLSTISRLSSELKSYAADPEMGRVLSDKITRLTTDLQSIRACIRQAEWVGRCDCETGCARCRQTGLVWRALVQVEGPEA